MQEIAENVLIFLAAFIVSTGACAKKAVQCGAEQPAAQAEVSAGK